MKNITDTLLEIADKMDDKSDALIVKTAVSLFKGLELKIENDQNVIQSAKALVKKLDQIHEDPTYKGVWTVYFTHFGNYTGPDYAKEFQELKNRLNDL